MSNKEMLAALSRIKATPDFSALIEFLSKNIETSQMILETETSEPKFRVIQGEIAAYRGILKVFDDLEMLTQLASSQDNPNVDPDVAGDNQ